MSRPALQAALPPDLRRLLAVQDGVATTAQLEGAGLGRGVLRGAVARREAQPLLRGTHLVGQREGLDLGRSWARSAALVLPDAVVGLSSAAQLRHWPVPLVADRAQVVVAPGRERARARGLEPHVWPLADDEVVVRRGVRTTSAVRTLADLLLRLDALWGLALLDAALRSGAVTRADLDLARALAAGRPGCRAAEDLWALADPLAESPLESRVRLRATDGGHPPDVLQHEVLDADGRFLGRSDMAYLHRRDQRRGPLLVEADGLGVHSAPQALLRDRHRQNGLVAAGCDVLRFTWADTCTPLLVPRTIADAL